MTDTEVQRTLLQAYRQSKDLVVACAAAGVDEATHQRWLKLDKVYQGAWFTVLTEKRPPKPEGAVVKRPMGRPVGSSNKKKTEADPSVPRGKPPRTAMPIEYLPPILPLEFQVRENTAPAENAAPQVEISTTPVENSAPGSPGEPPPAPAPPPLDIQRPPVYADDPPAPRARSPRIVMREQELDATQPETVEILSLNVGDQRALVDEYGELDRRMQMHHADVARYELLKKGIKRWFDELPPDTDGIVEGEVYRLHFSARERERRIKDMRELADALGLDRLLALLADKVPILSVERALGADRVAPMVVETRSGSRRLKAIAKRPAGV